ncbi:hypothetical protein [Devosia nitrariae]|uniref:Yip1 domain-containing protein n=1 Tax=Devosia nitrariae TaxID=2071872 RepID=A0ABQ5VZH4_9HYPH|nr:hypothetical protein [Devosia nitrariae]GLQ53225.1 hypothetical protein GCM10010862_04830 [Devosia nitrariae]
MRIIRAITGAVAGWRAILTSEEDWARHFVLTGAGLATALVLFFLVAFLILLYGPAGSAPDFASAAIGLLVFGLYVGALAVSAYATKAMLGLTRSVLDLLVPGTYAMIVFLVAGTFLAPLGPAFALVALLGIALLLFRLGQVAGGWSIGISAAFAVLTAVLLVAIPMTLYMLASSPAASL